MDEKVCESFLRRQAIQTDGFLYFGSLNGKSLINSLSSQSIFISGKLKLKLNFVYWAKVVSLSYFLFLSFRIFWCSAYTYFSYYNQRPF